MIVVAVSLIGSACSENAKRLMMTTGLGCGAGLAFGAVYDEMQRAKEGKERKKIENQVFNVFKKRKAQNKGKMIGLASGCLAGLGTGLYLNMMKEDIQENFGKNGIELEEVKDRSGETVALQAKMDGDISFENGKADLKGVGKTNVSKLTEALLAYPETGIEVTGHANKTGTEAVNLRISEERAKEVVAIMKDNGVDSKRVTNVKGVGSAEPMKVNGKEIPATDGRNRRVEIFITPQA
jgi:outer membrane protein OmpA-like peptidoglycan-associated protein